MSDGSYRFMTYWNESCATIDLNATASYSNDSIEYDHEDCSFFTGFSDSQGGSQLPFALLDVWQSGSGDLGLQASGQECSLSLCVQSYNNVTAVNGTLQLGKATTVANLTSAVDMSYSGPPTYYPFPTNATIMLHHDKQLPNETAYTADTTMLASIASQIFELYLPSNRADPAWLKAYDS